MGTKKTEWLNQLRGFAIIMIVTMHTLGYCEKMEPLATYIGSFVVPLFFFISGYLFKNAPEESLFAYAKRKALRVLVPYFCFALLSLIPFYMFAAGIQDSLGTSKIIHDNIFHSILSIFYASGHSGWLAQNSPLWFLPCYFAVICIAKALCNKTTNVKLPHKEIVFMIFFVVLGWIIYKYANYAYPFCLETAIVMLYFYFLGYFVRQRLAKNSSAMTWICFIFLAAGFVIHNYNGRISCMNNNYDNSYITLIFAASLTCIGYLLLFRRFDTGKLMSYIGVNTLPILVFHKMPLVVFQSKLGMLSTMLKTGPAPAELGLAILFVILSIISSLIAYEVAMRICPVIYGETKRKPWPSIRGHNKNI